MPIHLAAYSGATVANAMTNLPGLVDQVLTRSQSSGVYILQNPMRLLAALGLGATIERAQVVSPTLRQVNTMNFMPLNAGVSPLDQVELSWWGDQPPMLPALEEIQPAVLDSAVENATFLAWLADMVLPIPAGPILEIHATSTTAAAAGAWTILTYLLDQALPAGMYALVGSKHISATAIAHRWQIPGQVYRPGALSQTAVTDRTDWRLATRRLGAFGQFVQTALPQPEVLCVAADAVHELFMQIVPMNFQLNGPMAS